MRLIRVHLRPSAVKELKGFLAADARCAPRAPDAEVQSFRFSALTMFVLSPPSPSSLLNQAFRCSKVRIIVMNRVF